MAKKREILYVCDSCGFDSAKWSGKCPNCGAWNTMREMRGVSISPKVTSSKSSGSVEAKRIGEVETKANVRISTSFGEFDRVLGGREEACGIVPGAVMLLSGDPGVGKSTLLLQVALMLSGASPVAKGKSGKWVRDFDPLNVLYITGEESAGQVRMRAERIVGARDLMGFDLEILSTVDTDLVLESIERLRPGLVIVDSIQTIASESLSGFAGSVPQIRYATSQLVMLAKGLSIPIFLIGHVTKEGIVAGPQMLSHMVDCVLYLEGEVTTGTRILRAYKNRFGDTSEVGIFLMEERGLVELFDASSFFMDRRDRVVAGSCLSVVMEGSRPLLVEIQALSVPSTLAFPRRVSNGIESKRLELLLAVLQKHVGLRVDKLDIFVNVVGGLSIREVGCDLSVCLAIASSIKSSPLDLVCAVCEVGLLGELKRVPSESVRIREAERLGCKRVIGGAGKQFLGEVVGSLIGT